MSRKFIIASLLAAGFTAQDPLAAQVMAATSRRDDTDNAKSLFQMFRQGRGVTLAQHRSHSSHSSHRSSSGGGHYSHSSHTSHRSSTGGSGEGYVPAPVYSPPAPTPAPAPAPAYRTDRPTSLYSPPTTTDSTTANGAARSELFKAMVKRVQIALMARGYYDGIVDGDVGPATRRALRAYQTKVGLAQTGTISPETLLSLKLPSQ